MVIGKHEVSNQIGGLMGGGGGQKKTGVSSVMSTVTGVLSGKSNIEVSNNGRIHLVLTAVDFSGTRACAPLKA